MSLSLSLSQATWLVYRVLRLLSRAFSFPLGCFALSLWRPHLAATCSILQESDGFVNYFFKWTILETTLIYDEGARPSSITTDRALIRETNKNGGVGISRNANEKINIVSYALSIIQKVKERHEKNSNAAKYWVKTIAIPMVRRRRVNTFHQRSYLHRDCRKGCESCWFNDRRMFWKQRKIRKNACLCQCYASNEHDGCSFGK